MYSRLVIEKLFPTVAEELDKSVNRSTSHFDNERLEDKEEKNKNNQRLAGLQHLAQQPRLATEADVETNTKTRKCTEGAATDRAKHGDTSSTRVEDGPTSQTSFGDDIKPPDLPICRDDALVSEGAGAPKPCLSPGEVCMSKPTGGLQLASTASTTIRVIFPPPPLYWSLGETIKSTG